MAIDKSIRQHYDMQGGVKNYLGKQEMVKAPKKWKSGPEHPDTELAYITKAEKDLIVKADLHKSLSRGPNLGPSGVMSLNSAGSGYGGPGPGRAPSEPDPGGGDNWREQLQHIYSAPAPAPAPAEVIATPVKTVVPFTGPKEGPHGGDWEEGWLDRAIQTTAQERAIKEFDPGFREETEEWEKAQDWGTIQKLGDRGVDYRTITNLADQGKLLKTVTSDLNKKKYINKLVAENKPKGILSTIGGGLKKVFGETPLEWAATIASGGVLGPEARKIASLYRTAKRSKKALKFAEEKLGLNLKDQIKKDKELAGAKYWKEGDVDTTKEYTKDLTKGDERKDDIAAQIAGGTALESGQEMLGLDSERIQQIYDARILLQKTIDEGMYQNRRLNRNEIQKLQDTLNNMNNLIQAIEKSQAPIPVAHGGRIGKALEGGNRYI